MKNLWPCVPFFTREEFDSKDEDGSGVGTGDKMGPLVVFMLVALRQLVDRPLVINSGFRTVKHNRAIKGGVRSAHLEGLAVDIKTAGFGTQKPWSKAQRLEFINLARLLGFGGIGIGQTFIHIDMRNRIASWRYVDGKDVAVPVGEEAKWV